MTDQHPITPLPKKLLSKWDKEWHAIVIPTDPRTYSEYMYDQCAHWGADQELEACVNYIDNNMSGNKAREFRAIRRPKPPSLKEQALEVVTGLEKRWDLQCDLTLLRRALEALPND